MKSQRDSEAVDERVRSKSEAFHRVFCPGAGLFVQWKVRALRHVRSVTSKRPVRAMT